jgi:arylsulfatase A-like enzyme
MSLYPTLVELCGLPAKAENEGVSLVPLLRDPAARWGHAAITTHGRGNHSVRSERWRYIRYANGDEELYDLQADRNEWENLADKPGYEAIKKDLAKWLPKHQAASKNGS